MVESGGLECLLDHLGREGKKGRDPGVEGREAEQAAQASQERSADPFSAAAASASSSSSSSSSFSSSSRVHQLPVVEGGAALIRGGVTEVAEALAVARPLSKARARWPYKKHPVAGGEFEVSAHADEDSAVFGRRVRADPRLRRLLDDLSQDGIPFSAKSARPTEIKRGDDDGYSFFLEERCGFKHDTSVKACPSVVRVYVDRQRNVAKCFSGYPHDHPSSDALLKAHLEKKRAAPPIVKQILYRTFVWGDGDSAPPKQFTMAKAVEVLKAHGVDLKLDDHPQLRQKIYNALKKERVKHKRHRTASASSSSGDAVENTNNAGDDDDLLGEGADSPPAALSSPSPTSANASHMTHHRGPPPLGVAALDPPPAPISEDSVCTDLPPANVANAGGHGPEDDGADNAKHAPLHFPTAAASL